MYWCAVVAIPEKPNRMKGAQRPSPEDVAKAKAVLNGMSVLKNEDCTPDQLLELPLTSSPLRLAMDFECRNRHATS